jgi:hypothetical protein
MPRLSALSNGLIPKRASVGNGLTQPAHWPTTSSAGGLDLAGKPATSPNRLRFTRPHVSLTSPQPAPNAAN